MMCAGSFTITHHLCTYLPLHSLHRYVTLAFCIRLLCKQLLCNVALIPKNIRVLFCLVSLYTALSRAQLEGGLKVVAHI